ncbi:PRC-barrel domain containing protein [candidate division KSB3 bacterium]|jgi:hypothetical protein|uniref:PRC-barrel domain containing protein n=1 Tax=candidate division KSB3 bacterium TaxID=2044937 RepID=A0A9D5JSE4_9BACT|nr:PRC-barrel domain containing protein [candidate division KSB3 bacterium]MBD3323260.1 PRC-barrel domain containing protein [candidate division KSB3 bacterium]
MLRSLEALRGYTLVATDGTIGSVETFLFDDVTWTLRYAVVQIGDGFQRQNVLIAMTALEQPDWEAYTFPVNLTQEQIRRSPDIDLAQPISRQHQVELHAYYDWPQYWTMREDEQIEGLLASVPDIAEDQPPSRKEASDADPHLRSIEVVRGYAVQTLDGEIGVVEDFTVDDEVWLIRYIIVDAGALEPERKLVIAPEWVQQIEWAHSRMMVDLTTEAVKQSPRFDPSISIEREYEQLLHNHYARPKYWE